MCQFRSLPPVELEHWNILEEALTDGKADAALAASLVPLQGTGDPSGERISPAITGLLGTFIERITREYRGTDMGAISNDWLEPLSPEFKKPYYARLYKTVKEEYSTHEIFPPADDIFNAFEFTPLYQM